MSIGTNIKKRRFELRMSQDELAKRMGYKTRSTIAKIESDENSVTYRKLEQFAEVLDTSLDELTKGFSSSSHFNYAKPSIGEKIIAIILAGGKSTRNQQNIPNQFINILGKPVIMYSMETYQHHPAITEIYVVCLNGWESILESYANQYGITKLVGLIPGGKTGILSVRNALEYISDHLSPKDIIILQESTRPLVSEEMISNTIRHTQEKGASVFCEPMNEYLQFMDFGNSVKYIDRTKIVSLQSPEGYYAETLENAFTKAKENGADFKETCCAVFMYNYGHMPQFIDSYHNNIKIVRQEDLAICTALLKARYEE